MIRLSTNISSFLFYVKEALSTSSLASPTSCSVYRGIYFKSKDLCFSIAGVI